MATLRTAATGFGRRAATATTRPKSLPLHPSRQQVRWSSDHNIPDIAHNISEPLGWGFYATFLAAPIVYGFYHFSRPGANGELPWLTNYIADYQLTMKHEWHARNVARTQAFEQAAQDKHLFTYANMGQTPYYEVRFPDLLVAACPRNIPAGHFINIDHVVEHYRQKHLAQEEKKMVNLSAKAAKEEAALAAITAATS